MSSSIATRALGAWAFAFTCTALTAPPASAAPQIVQPYPAQVEYTIQSLPVDVALTPNGRRAAVRSANPATGGVDGITFFDLSLSPLPTTPIASFDAVGLGTSTTAWPNYMPSDRMVLTNTRGVAIGSGVLAGVMDQTYIEVFNASATPGLIQTHAFGNSGYANDVEITPDGSYAVVNASNYVYLVDVGNGNVTAINIGGAGFGPGGGPYPCDPNQAVDSVAVTNDFAVVTTARYEWVATNGGNAWVPVTWVYIVDINTKLIAMEYRMFPTGWPLPAAGASLRPHDVAITRDGKFAVVTCDKMIGLFDLPNRAYVDSYYDENSSRKYQLQVDSVEVTNDRAVIIADRMVWPPPGGVPFWQVEVWKLESTGLTLLRSYVDPNWNYGTGSSRSHDLAIAPGDKKAVVRTSSDNVIINDLDNPPVSAVVLQSPNSSNAYAFQGYPSPCFSSDSVVIGPLVNGSQIAVTIGGKWSTGTGWRGLVDFIDLELASQPTSPPQVPIVSGSTSYFGCVPVDLSLSRDSSHVVIRSADSYPDVAAGVPTSPGADVVFMPLTAVSSIVASFGGSGTVMALDSAVVGTDVGGPNGRTRAVTVSEDPTTNTGRVHIVDLP